jgi:predicted TIM-barrel fold metal-dependent hydrolase
MIVDMHQQLGDDEIFDTPISEAALLATLERNAIDKAIVHPSPGRPVELEAVKSAHDRIAALMKSDQRVLGACSISLHFSEYEAEVARCIGELGFVALRADPLLHVWNPTARNGRRPFEAAARHNVPLLVPLGEPGHPLRAPLGVFDLIAAYQSVKVVLMHTGAASNDVQCGIMAKKFDNVQLETSAGPNRRVLKSLVRQHGAERILFGSNDASQTDHALWMYRNAGLSDEELSRCMGRNAARLFGWRC